MAFKIPKFEELRNNYLRDIESLQPDADVAEGSDNYVRASVMASQGESIYSYLKYASQQPFADTAERENLERLAANYLIYPRNATGARGTATVSGTVGSVVPKDAQIKGDNDRFYLTSESITLTSDTATISVKSIGKGASENIAQTNAQFMVSIPGVQSSCVLNDLVGGTDLESDESLLDRYLTRVRRPPAGGNEYDYKQWALSVDGVTQAFVYSVRRGPGTVDIAITSSDGVASQETIDATQEYIDSVRCVTAKNSLVLTPTIQNVDFSINLLLYDGITIADIQSTIENLIYDYLVTLKPGSTIYLSQIKALISNVIGVIDYVFITPTSNVVPANSNEIIWFRAGTISLGVM